MAARFQTIWANLITIGGIRFAIATLWTYLDDTRRYDAAHFPDFVKIQGATVDKWNDLHLAQLTILEQAKADVIISHHAPFLVRSTRTSKVML